MPERERIGRYRVVRELGRGGMGVVYAAYDDQLDRPVAVKLLPPQPDDTARQRFWREARTAAGVSHPGICQVFEVGEAEGHAFIAMELLDGEGLDRRIGRGPLPVDEAVRIALGVLGALEALHARGIVHRDLKPSNIFLTPHGVKLLDFGLARAAAEPQPHAGATVSALTRAGLIVGTPHYMAPEQIGGGAIDARTDLFAAGAVLFEMLSGRRPFEGRTIVDVCHKTLHEQPPALIGSPAVAAADRVIRRAMAKRPADRFPAARPMADELREVTRMDDRGGAKARPMTRLVVLPFRLLRPDADIEFLPSSLADAISMSLGSLGSLAVRSSYSVAHLAADRPDLKQIAADADVDVVLLGSLLRAGDRLRIVAQLVEAPGGLLLWSHSAQVTLGDIFELQDALVRRLVEALSIPLGTREQQRLARDVPASPAAYEYYLRANRHARDWSSTDIARDLYLQSLSEDAEYAPAWAGLGRARRLIGKYSHGARHELAEAERCLERALQLNPDLSIAHNLLAHLEADTGRAVQAMTRLLGRARDHHDPDLFAGLVHVCRYCGLLDASLAAHREARRLDPHVPTSVTHTFWFMGVYERTIEESPGDIGYIDAVALISLGREEEATERLRSRRGRSPHQAIEAYIASLQALLDDRPEQAIAVLERAAMRDLPDPEARFYVARHYARVGSTDEAIALLDGVVEGGFFALPLAPDPWLQPLADDARFLEVASRAAERRHVAAAAFESAGGPTVLGVPAG
jgi:TolB-like protein/predicted Ser/Thr protein kinase